MLSTVVLVIGCCRGGGPLVRFTPGQLMGLVVVAVVAGGLRGSAVWWCVAWLIGLVPPVHRLGRAGCTIGLLRRGGATLSRVTYGGLCAGLRILPWWVAVPWA